MAFVDNTTGGRVITAASPVINLTVKASTTVNPGDPLGYSSGWVGADADAPIPAEFIAIGRSTGGDVIQAAKRAVIDFGTGCTATADDVVYLGSTAGQYSATAVTSYGKAIGRMTSAQVGVIDLVNVATPGAQITQTYSTTAGTLTNTAATAGGTTAATNSSPYGFTAAAQADGIVTLLNQCRADIVTIEGVLNHVINTLRTAGILA